MSGDRRFLAVIAALGFVTGPSPSRADGPTTAPEKVWSGKLTPAPGVELTLVFHVRGGEEGRPLSATMDSVEQGAMGLKVDAVTCEPGRLVFELKALNARFEGVRQADGPVAAGEWSQGGLKFPMTLNLTDAPTEARRPQMPKPPFPYRSEDVAYENLAGNVRLAGTLTTPRGTGPFPAAVLITGSGSQDRDETVFNHKPFLVLADALTRRGVAVLRVDDRGVGGTTGSPKTSTTLDYAGDVETGLSFLRSRPEIDPKAVGLIGHSEGGVIGPLVAARSSDSVAYVVMLAGTGLPGEEILYLQGRLLGKAMGADDAALARERALQERLFTVIKSEADPARARQALVSAFRDALNAGPEADRPKAEAVEAAVEAEIGRVNTPWFRFFVSHDPRPDLAKVRCPVLALIGERDLQVPPAENLKAIGEALKRGGNPRATVRELPGLNHLFQNCKTGSVTEYGAIEETFAPSALALIGDWVLEQVKGR